MYGNHQTEAECRHTPAKAYTDLEDIDGRLVDGADHRAACVNRVADRPHDNGSSSGVQAAGRLIHEHDGRVGHELDRDGEPLALLNAEPILTCEQ